MDEAPAHPHNAARKSFVTVDGAAQPAPTPRFSRTRPSDPEPMKASGSDTQSVLREFGFAEHEVETLVASGAVCGS
jgi:alpha-methylacyl-CoA racemase